MSWLYFSPQGENTMMADTSSVFGRRSPMTAGQQHLLCNLIEFPFYLNTRYDAKEIHWY